jgi:uncharacterized protein YcbK (DUF882 family)
MSLPDGRHFKYVDAACHDGTPYPEEWPDRWADSVGLADECRDEYGDELIPVSWYRSKAHNLALIAADNAKGTHGVASGSEHVEGKAVDLRPVRGDAAGLYRILMAAHAAGRLKRLGGIGLYVVSNWVHVDCYHAPDGHLRKWLGT